MNLGEGERRQGKDRLHLYPIAAGSAGEVRVALRIAVCWGYVDDGDVAESLAIGGGALRAAFPASGVRRGRRRRARYRFDLIDSILAMLWRITER